MTREQGFLLYIIASCIHGTHALSFEQRAEYGCTLWIGKPGMHYEFVRAYLHLQFHPDIVEPDHRSRTHELSFLNMSLFRT